MDTNNLEDGINLGAWLGRKQAFSGMAGRCSAADAHCLLVLREEKKYKATGLTWDEFCAQRLGISRAQADKTIRQLEEFGEAYFHLTGMVQISPQDYRLIAGAVSADGIEHGGERIAIAPQNAVKLAKAVDNLKQKARLALPAPPPAAAKPATATEVGDPMGKMVDRLQDAVEGMERLLANGPGDYNRSLLMTVLGGSARRLDRLDNNLRA